MAVYQAATAQLQKSLISLTTGGRLGETFAKHTDVPMKRDRPVVYDVSSIDDSDTDMQAAILLACWSAGFGTVNIANALADAGLEPRRHYLVVLDELWRALRIGHGMVDRVDALTRLNRQRGVGLAMISHTMSDLLALPNESDRMKARGLVERLGALPRGRAVVFASGAPATLIETVPWMTGPHAAAVRASIAAHDPANRPVALDDAADAQPPAELPVQTAGPDSGTQAWLDAAPRQEHDR